MIPISLTAFLARVFSNCLLVSFAVFSASKNAGLMERSDPNLRGISGEYILNARLETTTKDVYCLARSYSFLP